MPRDGEIAAPVKVTRRKRAVAPLTTTHEVPAPAADPEQKPRRKWANGNMPTGRNLPVSAHVGSGDASGDTGAKIYMQAKHTLPQVANFGAEAGKVLSAKSRLPLAPIPSGGQNYRDNHFAHAASETGADYSVTTVAKLPPSPTILALIELQRQRVFCIKSQSRCDRSCEAFIARYIGYSSPREKIDDKDAAKARKEIFARAAAMRRAVEKGGHDTGDNRTAAAPSAGREGRITIDSHCQDAPSACIPIIINSAASRLAWDNLRNQVESEMRKLAKSLPVYLWTESVKGFGELGLAVVVGEAGDLSNYSTKERLWKRLGLAVIDGERQQMRTNPEQAAAHGYYPRRRAEIWNITDSMFKHQWSGAKEGREAGPTGPYGEVYQRRKTHTATREGWSLKRRDDDARRIMSKALVEDLWRVWSRLSKRRNYQPEYDGDGRDV